MANKKTVKGIIVSVICLLAAACAVFGISRLAAKNSSDDEIQSAYREYNAAKGSITVGTSESGTASVGRTYVSFSASAEVEEVYVKVGSDVKEGDPIAKLNVDDIDEFKAQYESKLLTAKLELEAAENEKGIKLVEAENTYNSTANNSSSAETEYQLSVTKIEREITSAEKNLEELKTQLAEYEALAVTYPDDYAVYAEYDGTYEKYKTEYSAYEKTLKEYEKELSAAQKAYDDYYTDEIKEEWNELLEMQNEIERAQEAVTAARESLNEAEEKLAKLKNQYSSDTDSENSDLSNAEKSVESAQESYDKATEEYNEAYAAYDSRHKSRYKTIKMNMDKYQQVITEVEEKIEAHKEIMSDYSDKMSEYKSEYDEYNSDYSEVYSNLDEEGITEKIEKLKSDIENAEYELEKLMVNREDSLFSAAKDMQTSLINASNAEAVYNRTVQEINDNVSSKQDAYDKLYEEYNELIENIGDGLYIYADCNGAVSAVNISEGDTINSNMNVATIMDSSEIYVSVSVTEDDISSLTVGQAASVAFSAYENVNLEGEIDTIAVEPSRSSGSVTYEVTVKVTPNENIKIYEGMTCEITFIQKQISDIIYVNVQAVEYKGNGISTVLVYDQNGNAVEKEVVTGFTDGRYVEIISGIEAGETVLAESAVNRA